MVFDITCDRDVTLANFAGSRAVTFFKEDELEGNSVQARAILDPSGVVPAARKSADIEAPGPKAVWDLPPKGHT